MLKSFFRRKNYEAHEATLPEETLVRKCESCEKTFYIDDIIKQAYICPACGSYFAMPARARVDLLSDPGTFREMTFIHEHADPLNFPGYLEKQAENRAKTGLPEAFIWGRVELNRQRAVLGVMDPSFLMGSMGATVGENVTRSIEYATRQKLPLILITASGGARMQEGIFSLVQMAKTSAALETFDRSGGLYITVLTHPTMGGVTASFGMLGDIMIAERHALIGFAGPRVIKQTINTVLPDGFQTADFLHEHGMIDLVADRRDLKALLSQLIRLHSREDRR